MPWLNLFKKYAWESNVDKYELHNDFFVAPATRGWNRSQAGWVVESNCAGADESFASLCNCEQLCTNRKRVWQSLPPLPPELCIKTSFASAARSQKPARLLILPLSPRPSRDANTQMICTHLCNARHCNRTPGWDPNDMRERQWISPLHVLLLNPARDISRHSSAEMQVLNHLFYIFHSLK